MCGCGRYASSYGDPITKDEGHLNVAVQFANISANADDPFLAWVNAHVHSANIPANSWLSYSVNRSPASVYSFHEKWPICRPFEATRMDTPGLCPMHRNNLP